MTPPTSHPPVTTHLLYLHGFRSSPQSAKARQVAQRVAERHPGVVWCCPQLPPSPREAMQGLQQRVAGWPRQGMAVVGSSLGGFYARWLALQTGCRAALLNPAAVPQRDLARYIGEHSAWHDPEQRFYFEPEFVDELAELADDIQRWLPDVATTPQSLYAIVSRDDEVLDWREMLAFCAGGDVKLLPGGDHAISDFDQHIDGLFEFLNLKG
ncbi:YqiA/YcfP family alpha/beta fold hydrolase [Hydrogenophaga sp. A37]|uniref:YqiA/YcfP family alpha/beta fold hydrolase n=1 Tax=Hydrogenophaga sp. A37 TaxID=1945864 RepID=UPI0009860F96|nr:YqiA/YcfP family alpha/beta fold hydrolase [Hydrogenophaga sp. A37]OOG88257.1 esterase [Hydrogenophaga sp. A37]